MGAWVNEREPGRQVSPTGQFIADRIRAPMERFTADVADLISARDMHRTACTVSLSH